jgi:DNA polymerase III subunit chi
MTEVLFYHLTESTLEEALPSLLERSLARGWKVVVQTASDERRDALDSHLWTFRDDAFLAHSTEHDPHPEHQPIIVTSSPANPNAATVRFLVDGAASPELAPYERAVFLFDGHDEDQLAAARQSWTSARAAGHQATYWQQTPDGRWAKKA